MVAVHDVSLAIPRGSVCGLLGPNGSGKSTTLKALAGLVTPSAGECRIHGHPADRLAARRFCGYLPESPRFAPHQTAREFLRFCAVLANVDGGEVERVLAWSGLEPASDRRLGTYSKGMMQRLGLAQAILGWPPVLLLDEPESGLDPEGRRLLMQLIRQLRESETTIVLTSHLFAQAIEVCDLVAILGAGRLLAAGSLREVMGETPSSFGAAHRLEEVYLERIGHA